MKHDEKALEAIIEFSRELHKKVIDYKTLTSNEETHEEKVKQHLIAGWVPQGGVFIEVVGNEVFYIQAMIKYD